MTDETKIRRLTLNVKDKNVFISGPMTGRNHYNASAFFDAHVMLKEAGAAHIHNPAIGWLNESQERSHELWMSQSLRSLLSPILDFCDRDGLPMYDVLVSLPGWQDSTGATLEREVAIACGIEVCELEDVS